MLREIEFWLIVPTGIYTMLIYFFLPKHISQFDKTIEYTWYLGSALVLFDRAWSFFRATCL